MKFSTLTTLVFLFFIVKINAQLYTASGAILHLNNGATLTANNTNINSNSNISGSNNSKILMKGSTLQTIDAKGNKIYGIDLNNAAGIKLLSNVEIDNNLNFTQGKFGINGNTFTLGGSVTNSSATNCFIGSDSSKFVATTGTGTVFFDQSISADVNNITGSNALQNLSKTGSGTFAIGNKINVFNQLESTAGTIDLGGNVVLRSTAINTAYLDKVTGNITGQAIVERYIHKQYRGWRALTAPISFSGIINNNNNNVFNNWQSNFGYANNYGTRITANVSPNSTNGIDDYSNSASLMTYNSNGAGAWNRINNTKTEPISNSTGNADNKGFFVFVRGDRTVLPSATPNLFATTTLASKGLLQTGTQTFTYTGTAGNSWLTGNPYPCPVDMSTVAFSGTGNGLYVWDPNLVGNTVINPGAYTAYDRTNWAAGPVSGNTTKYFQSGQAFFVKTTSNTASIVYNENNKVTAASNNIYAFRGSNSLSSIFGIKLYTVLANGTVTNTDGVRAKYGAYSNLVDEDDVIKFFGTIESVSLLRNNQPLVIEARPVILKSDTLFLQMQTMQVGANYQFVLSPINFSSNVKKCVIKDNFLNTTTSVSLSNNTTFNFTITSVTGSNASNRFMVIFNPTENTPCVNGVVTMQQISGANNVCVGSTILLENETPLSNNATGVWSSIAGLATVTHNGIVTGNNIGTAIIKYTVTAGVCKGSITKNIVVNAIPATPTIGYKAPFSNPQLGAPTGGFCVDKVFGVLGSPANGLWTSTGSVSVTNNGIATINTTGDGSITYTFTNTNGCVNRKTMIGKGYICATKGANINSTYTKTNNNKYNVYPNPATTFINFNYETLIGEGQIIITDLYGKNVITQPLIVGLNTIDIGAISKGMYFITTITNQEKITNKFMKE